MSEFSKQYREKLLPGQKHAFADTDPEFVQIFESFAFDEVVNQGDLDERTPVYGHPGRPAGLPGSGRVQGDAPRRPEHGGHPGGGEGDRLSVGGLSGHRPGVPLPEGGQRGAHRPGRPPAFGGQATTTPKTRLEAGNQVQVDIFGEAMRGFQNSGPQESRHINKWLADNCFGDYYTRKGLDDKQREMITFCFLAAQGGCEPQLTSHATANIRIGNDKDFLIQVLSQCLPYIGYPRSLNALKCINEAAMG